MFDYGKRVFNLSELSQHMRYMPEPLGRKYCLNFAISDTSVIDVKKLGELFDKEKWMVKITPIHQTESAKRNKVVKTDGYGSYYPYKHFERKLVDAGWDVIVFIPSHDEEIGMVTCGNAVLSGKRPQNDGI